MDDRLVTVARFARAIDAQLAKARLEADGVPCHLLNEASAQLDGSGGVDLQVPTELARAASELLAELGLERRAGVAEPDAEAPRCLVCRSSLLQATRPSLVVRLLRGLLLQILPLPPEWLQSRSLTCGVCGHVWRLSEIRSG